jgi:hypothetical protein
MIAVPAGMRVLVATKPIDFRKRADGLLALVRETYKPDVRVSRIRLSDWLRCKARGGDPK